MSNSMSTRDGQRPPDQLSDVRALVIVNGIPGSGKSTPARTLSKEIHLPLISKDSLKDFLAESAVAEPDPALLSAEANDVMWAILGVMKGDVIVETWFGPTGSTAVRHGLEIAGVLEARVVELLCEVPREIARDRFMSRMNSRNRHPRHNLAAVDPAWWTKLDVRPLGVGRLLEVSTINALNAASVRLLAETIRALLTTR